jgi:hypothetical protein
MRQADETVVYRNGASGMYGASRLREMTLWQGVRSNTISKAFASFHLLDSSFTLHRPREDEIEGNTTQPRSMLERPPRLQGMLASSVHRRHLRYTFISSRSCCELYAPSAFRCQRQHNWTLYISASAHSMHANAVFPSSADSVDMAVSLSSLSSMANPAMCCR